MSLIVLRQLFAGKSGKLITNPEKVGQALRSTLNRQSDIEDYDFIIVGGGTAGCVLAARLSEDPKVRVLLLESGTSGKSVLLTRIPAGFALLFGSKHLYNLYTEPQNAAHGTKKYWPRGKLLGGCSSVNAQMAQYGSPQDFDEWAAIIGDDSWSWKNFRRYFMKLEKWVPDPDYPEVNSAVKGPDGPMRVGYFSTVSQSSKEFINSSVKLGIPFSHDFNTSQGTRGVNRIMTYIDENRMRVSSETAYLTNDVLARPNLKVLINATVTKVIVENVNGELRAVGIEFAKSKTSTRYTARAKRDVILAAGAIHSPHLLLLSGIGPAEELKKHNISLVKDLPGVGSHLVDHPVVDMYFKDSANNCTKYIKPHSIGEVIKVAGAVFQFIFTQRGALATNFGEAAAFCRTDDPILFPSEQFSNKLHDSTSGDDSPDLELFTTPFGYKDHGRVMFPMNTFSVHVCLLRPLSRGILRLKSANPFDLPSVDPKYLSASEDVERLVRGMKLIMKIAQVEPLASRLDNTDTHPSLDHQTHLKSDDELREIARERVESLYHPAGTCRMAPHDKGGVVDSRLRVYGIQGLRVCDASIFPEIVSGHTAGAVLASAEHLADIIRAEISSENKG